MTTIPPLPLSELVSISVTVAPPSPVVPSFNQGLIVGSSAVIPSYGSNPRIRQYSSTSAMLAAGFASNDPEFIAAQIYFSQSPTPLSVWIGRQDLTAIQTAIPHSGSAGNNYEVGDQVTVVQSGASNGVLTVSTIGAGGAVTGLATTVGNQGTGYADATGLSTTGGSGTGLEVDITAIGETLLQASQACRLANSSWYGLMVCGPVDADNLAIAEWADPLWQNTRYYGWSNDAAIPAGTANNLFLQLQALGLRVLMIYSTTQGGLYPENIYAAAAMMGVEMGLNTGLANSFFTIAHKELAGIAPEPLSQTQYNNVTGTGSGEFYGNVYANLSPYTLLEPGFMSNGAPSYLWLFLAMLVANLQYNCIDVLSSNPAVSQTNAGEQLLIQACNQACALLASIGFLAAGTWEGQSLPIPSANNPALTNGQALSLGYLNVAAPYAQQSPSARAAGQAMPIYCAITTAGAVQSLVIGVYVQL